MAKFKCDCEGHLLEVSDFSYKGVKGLSLCIYNIYGKYRKYKNPKLIADVAIMNNHYPKEYSKLIQFILKHSGKKLCQCKQKKN